MKNTRLLMAFMPVAICLCACAKIGSNTSADTMGECTLYAEDQLAPEDVKSLYEPGVGVHLSGTESVALFHKNGSIYQGKTGNVTYAIEAKPKAGEKGAYTFDANGYDAEGWYSVMPYHATNVRLQNNGSRVQLRLSPLQYPENGSFDPSCDFLMGYPFEIVDSKGRIEYFKRMFAPLQLSLGGIPMECVRAVTLSFDKDVAYNSNTVGDALTGAFYANFSEDFDKAALANLATGTVSNKVTAVFPDGLSAENGVQKIWYIVNAVQYAAGSGASVTVTTNRNIYTKSFQTGSRLFSIKGNKINTMSVDMSKGDLTVKTALTTSFASAAGSIDGEREFAASDSQMYTWLMSASASKGAGLNLNTTSQYVRIPYIPRNKVVGIKVYAHPSSYVSNSKSEASLVLKDADNASIHVYSYNQFAPSSSETSLNMCGGVMDIELPDGFSSMTGMKICSNDSQKKIINAITLVLEPYGEEPVHGELRADTSVDDVYSLIDGSGYQSSEAPDRCGVHTEFGEHITQSYDSFLQEDVFNFHIHINEDNDRGTDKTDRQRNEIKTDSKSPDDMRAQDGETLRMSWKFRLPEGMLTTSEFCHIHQLKGIGDGANVSDPLITFTCRTRGSKQVFQIISRLEPSDSDDAHYLLNGKEGMPLSDFFGEWVEVVETAKFAEQGIYSVRITRIRDGKVLANLQNVSRNFSCSGNPGYRPKWGIYRNFGENGIKKDQLRDETLQFADFKIEKL